MSDLYPETKPQQQSKLVVSVTAIPATKQEIDNNIDKLIDRLDRINAKCTLAGYPIIEQILKISHDKEELKSVAAGLDRAADIAFLLDILEDKKRVLEAVEKDPDWFALALGDIEGSLQKLEEGLEFLD